MRRSFQDACSNNVVAEPFDCSGCGKTLPAWALYEPEGDEDFPAWVCGVCIDAHAKSKLPDQLPPADPWKSEQGKWLKAERDLALNNNRWAVMPDSPLTPECQAEFMAYMRALHRMTVDCTPDTWTWPSRPEQTYN